VIGWVEVGGTALDGASRGGTALITPSARALAPFIYWHPTCLSSILYHIFDIMSIVSIVSIVSILSIMSIVSIMNIMNIIIIYCLLFIIIVEL
jgi:hypothetical protein